MSAEGSLGIVLGAAVKGLHDLGVSRAGIEEAFRMAIDSTFNPDPTLMKLGEAFGELVLERHRS